MPNDIVLRLREFADYEDRMNDTPYTNLQAVALRQAADEIERLRGVKAQEPVPRTDDDTKKLRIYINRNLTMTPNKRAAHAVHAALEALGVHPGTKVIVLDAGPNKIKDLRTTIFDAGHTEIPAGSMTAGTDYPEDSEP